MSKFRLLLAGSILAPVAAFAAGTPTITPGLYQVTTQYTALSDPNGICGKAGITLGGTTVGEASVGGATKTALSVVPQPTTAAGAAGGEPYAVNNLTCAFPAFPAKITKNGSTPYAGTTTCTTNYSPLTGGPASFTIVAGSGDIVTGPVLVAPDTMTVFHITSSNDQVQSSGITLCTISTDQLFQRTGK